MLRQLRWRWRLSIRHLVTALSLLAVLGLAPSAFGASTIDDSFDAAALDWCRWEDISYKGSAAQPGGELALSPSGTDSCTSGSVISQARLVGDFDMQVDFRFGDGLAQSPTSGGLNISLSAYWDDARYVSVQRARLAGLDGVQAYASLPELAPNNSNLVVDSSQAGTLRLVRAGGTVQYLYRPSGAAQWTSVATMTVPSTPAYVNLSAFNVGTQRGFTAYYDNFKLNSGTTDDIAYTQPVFYDKRSDFAVAAFVENYPVQRYWRQAWKARDFFDFAAQNGFGWVKTSVTTQSAPELAATPAAQWGSLAWQDYFWSAREYAAETLLQGAARGLRQEVQLLLSPSAAYWGLQRAPPDWANKTPEEIAPLLEQNVYETVAYFKSRGLNVEKYALGNEIDIGILDFLPGSRIAVPPGVNPTRDMTWMRDNVWPIEAMLLKAAASGVKRADPNARLIVHIAGLEFTPGNVFVPAFFQAMQDLGVPYDYAALSHPYATTPWKLENYPKACWFKRLALSTERMAAITGKRVMLVEASYPSAVVGGIVSAPMPDFPYTEAGQAAWIREELRFASSRSNVVGWHYFYPDMAANVLGATPEEIPLGSEAVFTTDTQPKAGLAEFRVNLQQPFAVNYQGLWYAAPAESEAGWGINFAHQGDTIFATWFTYDATGKAWWLTMTADKVADGVYSGTLNQTRGPPFDAQPFNPALVTVAPVGSATITFIDANNGLFAYTVNGVVQSKAITRQVFGPLPTCAFDAVTDLAVAANYQDLWYAAPAESEAGWGINLTHQGDTIFATWFTYDFDGGPLWLSGTAQKTSAGAYGGTLYRTTGPAYSTQPWDKTHVTLTQVGAFTLAFLNGDSGSLAYSVVLGTPPKAVTQSKSIVRQVFRNPGTVCQ